MVFFGKKGFVLNIIIMIFLLFILAVTSILANNIQSTISDAIQEDPTFSDQTKQMVSDNTSSNRNVTDNLFLFAFVIGGLLLAVGAYFFNDSPWIFGVGVFVIIAALVASAYIGETYNDIVSSPDFAVTANNFTITSFIMSHFVEFLIALSFIIGIVAFIRLRQ